MEPKYVPRARSEAGGFTGSRVKTYFAQFGGRVDHAINLDVPREFWAHMRPADEEAGV